MSQRTGKRLRMAEKMMSRATSSATDDVGDRTQVQHFVIVFLKPRNPSRQSCCKHLVLAPGCRIVFHSSLGQGQPMDTDVFCQVSQKLPNVWMLTMVYPSRLSSPGRVCAYR